MKILRSQLPGYIASLCIVSAAALGGCASDAGTEDTGDGDGDTATGGAVGTGGGAGTGGAPGTGGTVDATGGGSSEGQFPTDTTLAGIEAFLAAQSYKTWTGDPAPRPWASYAVHGDLMQVYFNDVAVATHDAAMDGAMTVKELYNAGGTKVGVAASWKTAGMWSYYCMQDDPASTACALGAGETYPVYGAASELDCGFCHGNSLISELP